ncbi:MAG: hypothetical protein HDR33_02005 [Treponema sp.]|nr:hypothetical protein [Treponema sp.]
MKKILSATILFAICFCVFADDASQFFLPRPFGNVKNYTETNFEITTKFGDYYRTPKTNYFHEFNENGLEIRSSEFNAAGQIVNRIEYAYNDDGNLFSQICYDDNGKIFWKIITSFDENGIKSEDSEYDGKDNLTGKSVYKNEGANPAEEIYYNAKGDLIWKNTFKYSDANLLEECCSYFANGQLDTRKVYKYDSNGNLLEITSFNVSDDLAEREVFSYNEDFTLNEYTVYGADGKRRTRIFYKYDENKNCVKSTTYNVAQKFGTTVNEMIDQSDFKYEYR